MRDIFFKCRIIDIYYHFSLLPKAVEALCIKLIPQYLINYCLHSSDFFFQLIVSENQSKSLCGAKIIQYLTSSNQWFSTSKNSNSIPTHPLQDQCNPRPSFPLYESAHHSCFNRNPLEAVHGREVNEPIKRVCIFGTDPHRKISTC